MDEAVLSLCFIKKVFLLTMIEYERGTFNG